LRPGRFALGAALVPPGRVHIIARGFAKQHDAYRLKLDVSSG
jgi:hypothetical protein